MDRKKIIDAVSSAVRLAVEDGSFERYQGAHCERLSVDLASQFEASHVLLTCSGTVAMELALRSVGVVAGDEVLLSAYDYPGNFWAIERVGARPVLVDVQPDGWQLDLRALEHAWTSSGGYKALIASHLHGQLQEVVELRQRCESRGITLLEDACQAVGGRVHGKPAGSFGHASIISFGGGKNLSAGRGGALLTSDAAIAQRAKIFFGGGSGPYALSELQAAVLVAQLPLLAEILAECRHYFAAVAECLRTTNGVLSPFAERAQEAGFYQAGFLLGEPAATSEQPAESLERQARVIAELVAQGVPAGTGFAGFHRRSARRCRAAQPLANTAQVAARTITIHHSAALAPSLAAAQLAELLSNSSLG